MTMLTLADTARIFSHHPPRTPETVSKHQEVRVGCAQLAALLDEACPDSYELKKALDKIQEAMFWANAAIAREGK